MDALNCGGTIIRQVFEAGADIMLVDDKLEVQAVSLLSKRLRRQLHDHKEDVIQALRYLPMTLLVEVHRRAWFDYGYDLDKYAILKLIPPSEWKQLSRSDQRELEPRAKKLALRALLHCGIAPRTWVKVLHCARCGWVFSLAAGKSNSCRWCEIRAAGVWFPTPGLNRCSDPKTIQGIVVQDCEISPGNKNVFIQECFFCGERHLHGAGEDNWGKHVCVTKGIRHLGHRQNHCVRKGIEMRLANGTLVSSEQGYFLGIGIQ